MKSTNITSSDADYTFSSAKAAHMDAYLKYPILELCKELKARKVLDLGCGNGALSKDLQDAGFQVTGVDPSESGIEYAKKSTPGGDFQVMGVYDDPSVLGPADYDVVVSTEVVEHLFYPRELPRFAAQVLRPGGYLIVSTPYHGYLKNLVLALTNKWDPHFSPLWDGGHVKFWSRSTLTRLLEEGGFEVTQFVGAGRLPFLWKSMILVARRRS